MCQFKRNYKAKQGGSGVWTAIQQWAPFLKDYDNDSMSALSW